MSFWVGTQNGKKQGPLHSFQNNLFNYFLSFLPEFVFYFFCFYFPVFFSRHFEALTSIAILHSVTRPDTLSERQSEGVKDKRNNELNINRI